MAGRTPCEFGRFFCRLRDGICGRNAPHRPGAAGRTDSSASGRESVALETSSVVVKQFDAVTDHIRAAQWTQAATLIRQLVTEATSGGEALIAVSGRRYVSVREYGHLLIAAWPPEGLAVYRRMVDPQAQQWLSAAHNARQCAFAQHRPPGI